MLCFKNSAGAKAQTMPISETTRCTLTTDTHEQAVMLKGGK